MTQNFKVHGPPPWVTGAAAVGFKFEDLPVEQISEVDVEAEMERMFANLAALPGARAVKV
jgi:hypothetical protein